MTLEWQARIESGAADAVAFSRAFVANHDLASVSGAVRRSV